MRAVAQLATAGLARAPARTALRVGVLAVATALLGAMLLFVGQSLRTMTASATRSVPLDWQGPVSSRRAAATIAAAVGRQPGVLQASPVATAPFAAAGHESAVGAIQTGRGAVLAVPPRYLRHLKTFRILHGRLQTGEVVLDQQLAATLQARVGDRVTLRPSPRARPRSYHVSGVALVTAPDVLFQPLDPSIGPAPAQPPAQIAILPLATFARSYAPALPSQSTAAIGTAAVPGAQTGVQWQVQAQLDPTTLASSPRAALRRENRARNSIQGVLTGRVVFVDNLGDALTTAAGDALYAETLFVMLAVPGALVALGLAYLAALGTAERDRRDLALLRTRGGSRRTLLALAAFESLLLGVAAGLLGAGIAVAAASALVVGGVPLTASRVAALVAVCILLALGGSLAARLVALSGGPSEGDRRRTPIWQLFYLDLIALAISGLIYWLTARTGFSAVVNPDSNPTLSLSVYMFFAPALFWLGATLLLVRARGRGVRWLASLVGSRPSTPSQFLVISAGRRGASINRGLVLVGLLLAFGVELALFTATYNQQARVDAQLTLGADVVLTAPPGSVGAHQLARKIATSPGVAAVSAVDHSYAYVGPDLQDTYGIDPWTVGGATKLRNSYFLGGSARQVLARLASTPDGILVSRETITDYSLAVGDLLRLRVLDRRAGRFRVVQFHVAGIVQEFPSAPKDSFMVANLRYLQRAARDGGPNVVFVRTTGDPVTVARTIAMSTKGAGASVRNIRQQAAQTVSSITTVDLSGIARIEGTFAVILAAAGMGLFVALGVAERRYEFATMAAIGASLRSIGAFVWSEAVLVLGVGLVLAAALGWLLAQMLVAMLRHVFDPPPDALAIPWEHLAVLAGAAIAGAALAGTGAIRQIRALPLGEILREQ